MTEQEALITINQLPKVGPITVNHLLAHLGSARAILEATHAEIENAPRGSKALAQRILEWKNTTNTERELTESERYNITILTRDNPAYPSSLKQLKDAPLVLYVKGTLVEEDEEGVAIVGSRKTTHYGRTLTEQFTKSLSYSGKTIISGLALGIDTVAHKTALSAQGRTIAVLGSGIGHIYPKENRELAHAISEQGAVISEFPLFTHPDKQTFPQRNRIVAALAKATLVTEMPERSGAMITANYARELSRPIFSIPGPIDRPSSAGCHLLIQKGATLVTCPSQVTTALQPSLPTQLDLHLNPPPPIKSQLPLNNREKKVLAHLSSIEQSIEELHLQTLMPISELSTTLFSLEMQDLITQHPGMTYTTNTP